MAFMITQHADVVCNSIMLMDRKVIDDNGEIRRLLFHANVNRNSKGSLNALVLLVTSGPMVGNLLKLSDESVREIRDDLTETFQLFPSNDICDNDYDDDEYLPNIISIPIKSINNSQQLFDMLIHRLHVNSNIDLNICNDIYKKLSYQTANIKDAHIVLYYDDHDILKYGRVQFCFNYKPETKNVVINLINSIYPKNGKAMVYNMIGMVRDVSIDNYKLKTLIDLTNSTYSNCEKDSVVKSPAKIGENYYMIKSSDKTDKLQNTRGFLHHGTTLRYRCAGVMYDPPLQFTCSSASETA
ncbi:hypothetical protein [Trichoplusia ni ascovirus 6b]|nr:hypothetical protein [Trichoplusia ni ascovirus 6b]